MMISVDRIALAAAFAFSVSGIAAAQPIPLITHVKPHRAMARGADRKLQVLYDQTANASGIATFSQNSDAAGSTAAADDFVVPDGATWTIKEVDVTGVYFNGSGPAVSENVAIVKDKKGTLGKLVVEMDGLAGADDDGDFAITLGAKGVKLKAGHYWVSVVANMDFEQGGQWGWENQTTREGDPAMWENPTGTTCTTWCVNPAGDQMFVLKGSAK